MKVQSKGLPITSAGREGVLFIPWVSFFWREAPKTPTYTRYYSKFWPKNATYTTLYSKILAENTKRIPTRNDVRQHCGKVYDKDEFHKNFK